MPNAKPAIAAPNTTQQVKPHPKPEWLFRQSAVFPWRIKNGQIQLMLVSTRSRKRWTVPKGVLEPGYTAWDSAVKEAREEAGVEGRIDRRKFGEYSYDKWGGKCHVAVYLLAVTHVKETWPEMKLRRRKWFSLQKCAKKAKHGGLLPLFEKLAAQLSAHNVVESMPTTSLPAADALGDDKTARHQATQVDDIQAKDAQDQSDSPAN